MSGHQANDEIVFRNMAVGVPNQQVRLSVNQLTVALGQGDPEQALGIPGGIQLNDALRELTVFKHTDERDGHWELYIKTVTEISIKIDLTMHQYRVLFNVVPRPTNDSTLSMPLQDQFQANNTTLRQAIEALAAVAAAMGPWTGTDQYNCQDFTVRYMTALGVSFQNSLKFALRRAILKKHDAIANSGVLPDGFG